MTATDLHSSDTFLAFCNLWKKEGGCPFPLEDYIREELGDKYAEALIAMATTERYPRGSIEFMGEWFWYGLPRQVVPSRGFVEKDVLKCLTGYSRRRRRLVYYTSFAAAIAALLDALVLSRSLLAGTSA